MRMAIAYRSSMVLFAATELDLFTAMSGEGATLDDLVASSGARTEPLRLLLESCAAEGLITVQAGRYRNTPATDVFLVRGRPTYSAHQLRYAIDLYEPWWHLADTVRTGRPAIDPESILGDDKAKTRAFVLAMHERARGMASVLPYGADFKGRRHVLDVAARDPDATAGPCESGDLERELALAIPVDPRDADDLALAHLEVDPVQAGAGEAAQLERGRARGLRRLDAVEVDGAADHQPRQLARVGRAARAARGGRGGGPSAGCR